MAVAPRVDLAPEHLDAVPGEPATFTLEVFNPSEVIEGYRLVLRGLPPEAVTAVPEHLNLFPGETGTMTFMLVLPPTFPAGRHAVGVEVETGTAPVERWTGALNLQVAAIPAAALRVDPAAVAGGRQVETAAVISNLGNDQREFVLTGADPEHATLVDVAPARVRLGPGGEVRSRVWIRGGRHLVGSPILRLVTVSGLSIRQTVAELKSRFEGGGISVVLLGAETEDTTDDDRYELRRVSDDMLLLWGLLSGTTDTDTVLGIYAPDPCTGGLGGRRCRHFVRCPPTSPRDMTAPRRPCGG